MPYWKDKCAIVTGGSAGLGFVLASELLRRGANVMLVARGGDALDEAAQALRRDPTIPSLPSGKRPEVHVCQADVTSDEDVEQLRRKVVACWDRCDFFCHAAGRSMRGDALATRPEKFQQLWEVNFLAVTRLIPTLAPLFSSDGHVVLVGSLATHFAPRYMGAYPASKFPLAAYAQQLRLTWHETGPHTLLVSPGPIARDDAGNRYSQDASDLPDAVKQPGGGAKVSALDPQYLVDAILAACEHKKTELILPRKAKLLLILQAISPRLADRML